MLVSGIDLAPVALSASYRWFDEPPVRLMLDLAGARARKVDPSDPRSGELALA